MTEEEKQKSEQEWRANLEKPILTNEEWNLRAARLRELEAQYTAFEKRFKRALCPEPYKQTLEMLAAEIKKIKEEMGLI